MELKRFEKQKKRILPEVDFISSSTEGIRIARGEHEDTVKELVVLPIFLDLYRYKDEDGSYSEFRTEPFKKQKESQKLYIYIPVIYSIDTIRWRFGVMVLHGMAMKNYHSCDTSNPMRVYKKKYSFDKKTFFALAFEKTKENFNVHFSDIENKEDVEMYYGFLQIKGFIGGNENGQEL